ncbi:hypothetical protein RGU72_10870 [Undibacterium sp. 5I1]|uniref:surface-adhesin E family protein n=1 Tax=unclassified Undibacterium TaxID=2630295 RepID=UPI002AB41218|nr:MULTISPECIES: surface-adhesin E family protein [unclassified Undibacterium]MDY7538759.1 hypothetical protein [Undibacterium sp. 5I1]MEB0229698.1 hypothetical protein [Undibacterium sp. 10I3]MEB0258437.1 hypothetical protein [Undibacterium sp. 5I1]
MLTKIVGIAVSLLVAQAEAATWENIPEAYVVDTSSIRREGDTFVVWQKMEFGGPTDYFENGTFVRNDNLPKQQILALTKYDCKNRTFQYLHILTYKNNKLI